MARRLAEHDVWWAPVNSVPDLLADAQVAAAGELIDRPFDDNGGGTRREVATPVHFEDAPIGTTGPPPTIGADTDAVLREIGFSDDDLRRLHADGILGGAATPAAGKRT
jgi:crotonobetainyl-CoA:carnitine CoA-transferase CaiB-like acyl-CoA transferase